MKRIEKRQSLNKKIAPISLFLDDLEYILEVAKKYEHKIDISDKEFTFDNIEELNKVRGKKVIYLKIEIKEEVHWKSVDLEYEKGKLAISSWRGTDTQKLIFFNILDHLQNNRPIIFRILSHITFWPAYYFLCCSVGILILFRIPWVIVTYFALLFLSGGLWLANLLVKRFAAAIYLQRRHDVESFLKRNADRIILLIIGAAIGGAIKWVFDILLKLQTK